MSKTINLTNKTILISRTDSIGDVMLTLPMCVWIKQHYPTAHIIFLAKRYTQPVLSCLPQIDDILIWDELEQQSEAEQIRVLQEKNIDVFIHVFPRKKIASLACKAKIPVRVGTLNRLYHLLTCNIRPYFSRVKSELHEAQLNFNLLKAFGLTQLPTLSELSQWMAAFQPEKQLLPEFISLPLSQTKHSVILHPKSQGSAVEWPIENYLKLADLLTAKGYLVLFTGTEKEGQTFRHLIANKPGCLDTTGKLTLSELIVLISQSDALVACSTGPLHIAGVLGLNTIGLFSPRRPIHPGRWMPLGSNSHPLIYDANCNACKKQQLCQCIKEITPEKVLAQLVP